MAYFKDKIIWLTGAGTGIGAALAKQLISEGAQLYISGRRKEPLEQVAQKAPEQVTPLPMDVGDRQANLAAMETIRQRHGRLDLTIFNAGICLYLDVKTFDSTIVSQVMQTNYMGMVYGIEAALPLLRRGQAPHIVGVGSSAAYAGMPRAEAYGASKAAMHYFLDALRADLTPEGIAVTTIAPGFVDTPLTRRNDFPMPFMITPEKAARRILRGLRRRSMSVDFPKRLSLLLKLMGSLPKPLQNKISQKMVRS